MQLTYDIELDPERFNLAVDFAIAIDNVDAMHGEHCITISISIGDVEVERSTTCILCLFNSLIGLRVAGIMSPAVCDGIIKDLSTTCRSVFVLDLPSPI